MPLASPQQAGVYDAIRTAAPAAFQRLLGDLPPERRYQPTAATPQSAATATNTMAQLRGLGQQKAEEVESGDALDPTAVLIPSPRLRKPTQGVVSWGLSHVQGTRPDGSSEREQQ